MSSCTQAYSDFTLETAVTILGVTTQPTVLFPNLAPLPVPGWLQEIPLFGCVTTGEVLQFLKLREAVVLTDENRYYLDDIGSILAAIQFIVAEDLVLLA